nr:hypothetical protein [uncultured Sphaerochaeta sp.]
MKKGVLIFLLPFIFLPLQAQMVNSLSEVSGILKTEEGLSFWNEQMLGLEDSDGFGSVLPPGISEAEIIGLIAPHHESSFPSLFGLKPWSQRENCFIAMALFHGEETSGKELNLALLEDRGDGRITLLARNRSPLDLRVGWNDSDLGCPVDYSGEEGLEPMAFDRFDFGDYGLNDEATAFGIRVSWFEGYAGGGAEYQALMLFLPREGDIVRILAQPVFSFTDYAGDWNEDGTRQHSICEDSRILLLQDSFTEGFRDISVTASGLSKGRTFRWDKDHWGYLP